jgi:hypothetical protein
MMIQPTHAAADLQAAILVAQEILLIGGPSAEFVACERLALETNPSFGMKDRSSHRYPDEQTADDQHR